MFLLYTILSFYPCFHTNTCIFNYIYRTPYWPIYTYILINITLFFWIICLYNTTIQLICYNIMGCVMVYHPHKRCHMDFLAMWYSWRLNSVSHTTPRGTINCNCFQSRPYKSFIPWVVCLIGSTNAIASLTLWWLRWW